MDQNITSFDPMIFDWIRSGHIGKAIDWLTQRIDGYNQLSGDYQHSSSVDTRLHNHLLRSYCYYKLGTTDAFTLSLEDVFNAVDLDDSRCQPYLLGALILLDMKQWTHSLQMFEKSIEINPNLFQVFVHKMVYLKFKILTTDGGVDEELALRCALTHRFLDDCHNNIESESVVDTDSHILQLLARHRNKYLAKDLVPKKIFLDCDDYPLPQISDQMMTEYVERLSSPIDDFFCSGDQKSINPFDNHNSGPNNEFLDISLASKAITDERNPSAKVDNCLATKFNGISILESEDNHRSDSIQKWIETNFRNDSVSKMCSFSDKPESPPNVRLLSTTTRNRQTSISVSSDVTSIYLDEGLSVDESRHLATNLLKLRGVYVGNLKKKCNEKVLKDLFRKYGTIVDFYQPFGQNYAFIHFKSYESALNLLIEWKGQRMDVCADHQKLMVRFTPSQEQMSKYNSMSLADYQRRCNQEKECHLWRAGKRCPDNDDCSFKHIPINRAIDTLPDKRKANWKCN